MEKWVKPVFWLFFRWVVHVSTCHRRVHRGQQHRSISGTEKYQFLLRRSLSLWILNRQWWRCLVTDLERPINGLICIHDPRKVFIWANRRRPLVHVTLSCKYSQSFHPLHSRIREFSSGNTRGNPERFPVHSCHRRQSAHTSRQASF